MMQLKAGDRTLCPLLNDRPLDNVPFKIVIRDLAKGFFSEPVTL